MNEPTENDVSQDIVENPADQAEITSEAANEETTGTVEQAGEEQEDQSKKDEGEPWFKRRIDKLTAQKRELEQRLAAVTTTQGDEQTQALIEQRAAELAESRIRARTQAEEVSAFNKASNDTFEAGAAAFEDFDKAVNDLRRVDGFSVEFVRDVLDVGTTEQSAKVLYELGKNPDEAERLLALPERKRVIEITKLALAAPKTPKVPVSNAPPPPKTVAGAKAPQGDLSDELSTDEWARRRNKQLYGR